MRARSRAPKQHKFHASMKRFLRAIGLASRGASINTFSPKLRGSVYSRETPKEEDALKQDAKILRRDFDRIADDFDKVMGRPRRPERKR